MADTAVTIPTALDTPLYSQRTTLDGKEYLLKFDYSEREDRWFLSLYDVDETPLALGIKVIPNWPLLRLHVSNPDVPQGKLVARDFSLAPAAPGFGDLGRRVSILYYDEEALVTLAPQVAE